MKVSAREKSPFGVYRPQIHANFSIAMSSQARSRGGMEAEDEDVTFSSEPEVICGLGVVIASTFLSVTFGGLGYILCDGVDRCFPSLLGEVCA